MQHAWLNQHHNPSNQGKIGLIDIGSNSVRLVVYDRLKRAPAAIYNEKVMCQLGKGLSLTGKLNPDGIAMADRAIARYVALAKNMDVTELDVIATAAVREASDGNSFVERLERQHNIFIEVISGRREAKLGAYGVLSSIHQPCGLVADLGGGSLELVTLDKDQRIGERVSLPIGALRLVDECGDAKSIRKKVRKLLAEQTWFDAQKIDMLYIIGGSFRNLARMHAISCEYPLPLTQGYSVKAADISPMLETVASSNAEELSAMAGASNKRLTMLPAAAIVLEELAKAATAKSITFSSSGIREGYLFEKLSPFMREEDGLIASCIELASRRSQSFGYARELFEWMQQLLQKQSESSQRIAYAACLLQDIAMYINPDDQANWAFERVIESNFNGVNHKQRTQLALTLYYSYRTKLKHNLAELALVDDKSHRWSELIGSLANLAYRLTGGVTGALKHITLDASTRTLNLPDDMMALSGEAIEKRLGAVFDAYEAWQQASKK